MSREISSQPEMRVTEAELSERQVATAQQLAVIACKTDFELCDSVKNGDELATTVLIERFGGFIFQCAQKELSRHGKLAAIDADDLIQEGRLGLLHAVEKVEMESEYTFLTYAAHWVHHYMQRHVSTMGSTVRLSQSTGEQVRLARATNAARMNMGRRIMSDDILASELGIPKGPPSHKNTKRVITTGDIRHAELISYHMGSIDTGWNPNQMYSTGNDYILDEHHGLESITTESLPAPDEQAERSYIKHDIEFILETLDERECEIIKQHFGLYSYEQKTLEEIGSELNLTRERIRQIEAAALGKLRKLKLLNDLSDYI